MYRYFISIMLALSSMIACSVHAINFVDLGLPSGNLWADENLGSKSSSYYAWGEIYANKKASEAASANFTWKTYFDEKKAPSEVAPILYLMDPNKTKNNVTFSGFSSSEDCGTLKDPLFCVVPVTVGSYTHGGRSLPAVYDAATKALGKDYIIPSQKDFQELFTYTTHRVSGSNIIFTSKRNNNSISFPMAGMRTAIIYQGKNSIGYYWTSDPNESNPSKAICAKLTKSGSNSYSTSRYNGLPIRPVKRKVTYTKENLYIGLGEPSSEITHQHESLTYANNNYVSDMAAAFGVSTFRVWVSMDDLFTFKNGELDPDLFKNGELNPNSEKYENWEKLRDLVTQLTGKGVNRICFLPCGYVVDISYPNYFCWNKSENKLAWYSASQLAGKQDIIPLVWAHSCSPDPYNDEPDDYIRFLKNQETAFKILAESFPEVEFFEASNEPDLGNNIGDKWQYIINNSESIKDKLKSYNSDLSILQPWIETSLTTGKYPADLLYQIQTDLCYYISTAFRNCNRSNKPKLLSPAFTTTGTTFDFLKGMYNEIANGYRVYGTGAFKDTDPNHYFQILNIHPYLFHDVLPEEACGCKSYNDWRSHVEEIYKITIDNGHRTSEGKTIPVWFTEFGFTDVADSTYRSWKKGTQNNQYANAKYLYECIKQAKNMGFVNTVVAFRMNDFKYTEINTYTTVEGNYGMVEYLTKSSDANKSLKPIGERLCGIVASYDTKAIANGKKANVLVKNVRSKIANYINKLKPQPAPMSSMPTDVDDAISVSNDIAIYPNPTTGLLYVACGDGQTIKTLSLMDANGKVLMVKEVNEDVSVLDLSHWEKNLYFVKITTNENTVVEKILLK